MLRLFPASAASCEGLTRREILCVGSACLLGLSWPHLLKAAARPASQSRAKACVVIFLFGGPGQQDLWDLKPEAPEELRGEFKPTATRVPGLRISDQLPYLAQQTDK